jgi:hypothetical protein
MLMMEKMMERVCEWKERIAAQTVATVERDVGQCKRHVVNCKDALRKKGAALTEAEKEQEKL